MTAHQIFQQASPALASSIVNWLRTEEHPVYKAAITALAQQKKLRPIFILEKKTKDQQVAWMIDNLKLPASEAAGENLLQIWLMKSRKPMLRQFLNKLNVQHDGDGAVEGDVPAKFDPALVKSAILSLVEEFPSEEIALYLHLFQLQQPGGWPEILAAMEDLPTIKLGA